MKYNILIIIMFFTGIMVQAQMSHTVNFSSGDYTVQSVTSENGETYNQIVYDGLQFMEEPGYPDIPVRYVKLIIPSDKKVEEVTVNSTQTTTLPLGNRHGIAASMQMVQVQDLHHV